LEGFQVGYGEEREFGFRPVEPTWADEWFRWTAAYRRSPLFSLGITALFAVLGRIAVPTVRRQPRPDRAFPRIKIVLRALAAVSSTLLLSLLMFFHWAIGGGSALTFLPPVTGLILGIGSRFLPSRSMAGGQRLQPSEHS